MIMTNADRIRNMSDEELACLIDDSKVFFSCDECDKSRPHGYCDDCKDWILRFLQKDV